MGLGSEFGVLDPADDGTTAEGCYQDAVDHAASTVESGVQELEASYDDWETYGTPEARYERALDALSGATYTAESVERFCAAVDLDGADGPFVSAAINAHSGTHYELPDMSGVRHVGYRVEGEIVVDGDAGDNVGVEMRGRVRVKGNVGRDCGVRMAGGTLLVEGSARDGLGARMEGGRILVHGNTLGAVGHRMEGGEIRTFDGEDWVALAP